MTEIQAPEGSNQALFVNNWRFTEVSSSLNGVPIITEAGLCGWFNSLNLDQCYSEELNDFNPNCPLISSPINDVTLVITNYGTWFFTYYSNSNAINFLEGQWRWTNGDFTTFEVIDEEHGGNWEYAQLINIVSVSGSSLSLSSTYTEDVDGDGIPDELLDAYSLQIQTATFSYPICILPTN